ncbi:hypothetical protein JZX89_23205 [Agrobacterium sp. Rnr]|uniref:Uncharacterized protein n=1 Tax=Agrobacterium burrii TaxID=2815339 RepID=A0ABS3EP24_9HYPH|nr:hypothetical protein [Agrobacterium burrii]
MKNHPMAINMTNFIIYLLHPAKDAPGGWCPAVFQAPALAKIMVWIRPFFVVRDGDRVAEAFDDFLRDGLPQPDAGDRFAPRKVRPEEGTAIFGVSAPLQVAVQSEPSPQAMEQAGPQSAVARCGAVGGVNPPLPRTPKIRPEIRPCFFR